MLVCVGLGLIFIKCYLSRDYRWKNREMFCKERGSLDEMVESGRGLRV